ncbi:hypothetical protein GQ53DRAFT_538435 [Thozetella sp. PMI_491]|nr:hypothetical protein GQ53DRAFT_538435 [Thozetella sp. PMI_491]
MLDENLPTFRFKSSSDNPLSTILYFSQNGSEPAPEYVLRRPDRNQPAARNKYAIALCDPYSSSVVYGEIVIDPEWTQPTLSAAEVRAQQQSGAGPAPAAPVIPDTFTVLLYNPDLAVTVRMVAGSWGKSDSWEFELPTQAFRMPSASELDREQGHANGAADLSPKLVFRWKKDGRLSKDMSCFMSGKNVGGKKSKEPDITVALFKAARETAVTIYEPNMQRVELEDRKGWEVVVLLAAEAIKDLYLMPRQDPFNVSGAPLTSVNGAGRKNSRPTGSTPPAMSGALAGAPSSSATAAANVAPAAASTPEIEAETRRLQAMVEQEEREREKRDKAEQKRIKKMLEEEEKDQRRRQAEVDKETERLRREFGMAGQELPSARPNTSTSPPLPPRHQNQVHFAPPPPGGGGGGWYGGAPPPRPVSAGPAAQGPNSWWRGPSITPMPQPQPQQAPPQQASGRRRNGSGGLGLHQPAASVSQFFGGGREEERNKVKKKRSMHW